MNESKTILDSAVGDELHLVHVWRCGCKTAFQTPPTGQCAQLRRDLYCGMEGLIRGRDE